MEIEGDAVGPSAPDEVGLNDDVGGNEDVAARD
jgi:hypothetical protein